MELAQNSSARRPALAALGAPPLAFLLGALFFYLARGLRIPGGDTVIILGDNWASMLWAPGWVYYAREPWCHSLAHFLYGLTHDLAQAYAWYGALAGGLFLAVLAAYCRRPLFWAVMLCSAATWNFVGHIEYYAPFMAVFLLLLITLARALEPAPRAQPVHVAFLFALSYLFHKLTLFFLPAMLWLFIGRVRGRWVRRPVSNAQVQWSLAAIVLMVLADLVPTLLLSQNVIRGQYVAVNEGLMDLITPLTPAIARHFEAKSLTGMFYVYTFGHWKHFAYFFGFLLAGAPLGLALTLRHRRRILESESAKALALAAACGLIWTFMWQPRGFWKDWDLFCLAGMPLNLLGAGLALGLWRGEPLPRASRREWFLSLGALALFCVVASVAALQIQAARIAPGMPIAEFVDSPLLRRLPAPPPGFKSPAADAPEYERPKAFYDFPASGLPGLFSPAAPRRLVAVNGFGKIVSVANPAK